MSRLYQHTILALRQNNALARTWSRTTQTQTAAAELPENTDSNTVLIKSLVVSVQKLTMEVQSLRQETQELRKLASIPPASDPAHFFVFFACQERSHRCYPA